MTARVRPDILLACILLVACTADVAGDKQTAASRITNTDWAVIDVPPKDAGVEARVEEILNALTIEQKVGQIIQADSASITPEEVRHYRIGSVLSGGNSAPGGKPYADAGAWLVAADAYWAASVDPAGVEVAVPVIWGIDAVHGHNNVTGGTIFPHNIGLGAARDEDLVRRIAAATAIELRVTGHDWTFSPTLAVPQDDRWGRTYEGFSEDPDLVASYADDVVIGLQGEPGTPGFLGPNKVVATAKHFVGDGGTFEGRDQGDARISEAVLREVHAAGYPPAIEAGVQAVMASFSSWNGIKVHGDPDLLTGVLREAWGFDGLVVGDWNAHGQLPECENDDCPEAIRAGLDMFMAPQDWKRLYDNTLAQVQAGEISAARLDEAVRRVLRVKVRAGLFDAPTPSRRPLAGDETLLAGAAHRALAREAVAKSLVLLKNEDGVLPLDPAGRYLVAGAGANSIAMQAGGWTLTWQGGEPNAAFPRAQTIFSGISETVRAAGGEAVLSPDGTFEDRPDAALVIFGEQPYAEFQGDVSDLAYRSPEGRDLALLRRLRAQGIPTIAVFLTGRPLWVNPHLNASHAFLVAWLPGTEGGGVADVLFAAEGQDATGKLPFSWPARADAYDTNVVGGEDQPLFEYGFGLSFSEEGGLPVLPGNPGPNRAPADNGTFLDQGRIAGSLTLSVQEGGRWRPLDVPGETEGVGAARVDATAQEDALRLSLPGGKTVALRAAAPLDLRRETNAGMALSVIFSAGAGAEIGMLCAEDPALCGAFFAVPEHTDGPADGLLRIDLPLRCFAEEGLDPSAVYAPLALRSHEPVEATLQTVGLVQEDGDPVLCGERLFRPAETPLP